MKPVDPRMDGTNARWRPVIYGQNDPKGTALAALQEVRPHRYVPGFYVPYRVVTVWEPDNAELLALEKQLEDWRSGTGPKPRISVMSLVQEAPLQAIELTVGEFSEPYRGGSPQTSANSRPPVSANRYSLGG